MSKIVLSRKSRVFKNSDYALIKVVSELKICQKNIDTIYIHINLDYKTNI